MKPILLSFLKRNRWYFLLIVFFFFAYGWKILWANELLLSLWGKLFGILPDGYFFPCEEFIAFQSHGNTLPASLFFWVLSSGILIYMVRQTRKKEIQAGFFYFLIVLFLASTCNLLPCLCRAKEYGRRIRCQSSLRKSGMELKLYLDEYETLPSEAILEDPHGRIAVPLPLNSKMSDCRYVVYEDAPRTHAGDLRHRLWSDGTIDSCYPWKTGERIVSSAGGIHPPHRNRMTEKGKTQTTDPVQ